MEKFEEIYENWLNVNAELYNSCIEYLKDTLSKIDGNSLSLEDDEYYVSIPYDGGRHPEYASNCFSRVNGVYLKDGELFFSIEETDEYELDRVDAINLYDVAHTVKTILENKNTESEFLDEDDDDYGESEYLEGYLDVRTNKTRIPY